MMLILLCGDAHGVFQPQLYNCGCTTSCVNCANEPSQAVLERSSQDAHGVIRLMRSKATVWTLGDVARLIDFLHSYLFIILFFYPR